ncbi:MAG: class I SAM-dependent RNA methyltransferase [Clostridia bacterium]|nr:class I SAM-dependent RNA methyltransferase [Clostridia bacterium]
MSGETFRCIATAAFGTEGLVAAELKRLGFRDARAESGGACFTADAAGIALANLRLRCADRVLILLAEEKCETFDALFRLVERIPWEKHLAMDGRYNVSGKCVRSKLMSVRDCQSITKKALIERMRKATGLSTFPETGAAFPIEVSLHSDIARISLDTSGTALNRRGYRTWNGEAPLRETLAAALVELSPWRPGMPLHDPCCGTGTLIIEAALRAAHIAPGIHRIFACESFPSFQKVDWKAIREQLQEDIDLTRIGAVSGSDIDPESLELARRHVKQAGLEGYISLLQTPLQELQREEPEGVFLCNPPYGERLGDRDSCRALYADLHKLQRRHPGWKLCAISSDPGFERAYGRHAARRRRLYNGRLECEFLIFE